MAMQMLSPDKDPLGQAALDYLGTGRSRNITVESDLAEDDHIPSDWLFRDFAVMPAVEQAALRTCRGTVLDVGAGAGSHALWLQEQGLAVTAVELSELCCRVMRQRGVAAVLNRDIAEVAGSWDTILFMMNGLGIGGDTAGVAALLAHCRTLLAPGGQIIFDSTDVSHLYEGEEFDDLATNKGEFRFTMRFGDRRGDEFPWIYLDAAACRSIASQAGLELEVLQTETESGAWLGRLSKPG